MGQTSRNFQVRLNEHKSNIRLYSSRKQKEEQTEQTIDNKNKYGEITVAKHFFDFIHQVSVIRWQVIERIFGEDNHNTGILL